MASTVTGIDWDSLRAGDDYVDVEDGDCPFSWMAQITSAMSAISYCNRDSGHEGQHVALGPGHKVQAVCKRYGGS